MPEPGDYRIIELVADKITLDAGARKGLLAFELDAETVRFQYGDTVAYTAYLARVDVPQIFQGPQAFAGPIRPQGKIEFAVDPTVGTLNGQLWWDGGNLKLRHDNANESVYTTGNLPVNLSYGVCGLDISGKVDTAQLPDSLVGAMNYQGVWLPASNTPALPTPASSNKGFYWICTNAGTYGGKDYVVGDWVVSSGTNYDKIDNTDAISSFNGRTGAITPLATDYESFYLSSSVTVLAANGGTGLASYTTGDLLYASSPSTLAKLVGVATGNVLRSGGVGVAPSWGKVDLAASVSGTLPVANGGTGSATRNFVLLSGETSSFSTTGDVASANTDSVLLQSSATYGSVFSKSNGTFSARDFLITNSASATSYVGTDFDIRNSKRLLLGGTEVISAARAGTFVGLSSSAGATITGGKLTLAASTTAYATGNIPAGATPTVKNTGDFWNEGGTAVWLYGAKFMPNGLESRTSVPYNSTGATAPVGTIFDEYQYAVDENNVFRIFLQVEKTSGTQSRASIVIGHRGPSNTGVLQTAMYFYKNSIVLPSCKLTLAAATATYPTINFPTSGAVPTTSNTGDLWSDGYSLNFNNLGLLSTRGANDAEALGSHIKLIDSVRSLTKGWELQLGVNNTLDFWNYAAGAWGRQMQLLADGTLSVKSISSTGMIRQNQLYAGGVDATIYQAVTIPIGGMFEVTVSGSCVNAGTYGVTYNVYHISTPNSAYPYATFAPVHQLVSSQSQNQTGPAPTLGIALGGNGQATFSLTGTGTKTLDIVVRKMGQGPAY